MKVTYNSPHFYIDGVQVIDAEVLTRFFYTKDVSGELLYYTKDGLLKDGDSFDLPSNIIAELKCQHKGIHNSTCRHHYRLKLKEPLENIFKNERDIGPEISKYLVDTGSKETFKEVESHKVLRKHLEDVKGNESYPLFSTRIRIMKAMEEYSQQQLSECKQKLKAEIENAVKQNKGSHLLTESQVLTLIDKI